MPKYTERETTKRYHQKILIMRRPIEKFVQVNNEKLCTFDWPGDAPALLFAHGASFHARCWDAVIERLPNRCIAIDLRGHGRSDALATPLHWRVFAEDVIAAAEITKTARLIGVGHSLGGHAIVHAAALHTNLFDRLVLIDPVILPSQAYVIHAGEKREVRRRSEFASVNEMKEKLGARLPFSAWDARVFDDYCRSGLLPTGDGFTLACSPATEVAVYDAGTMPDANLSGVLPKIDVPTSVIRSARLQTDPRDFMASPTRPDLAALLPHGTDRVVEGSHFIPMESPDKVAAWIEALMKGD